MTASSLLRLRLHRVSAHTSRLFAAAPFSSAAASVEESVVAAAAKAPRRRLRELPPPLKLVCSIYFCL